MEKNLFNSPRVTNKCWTLWPWPQGWKRIPSHLGSQFATWNNPPPPTSPSTSVRRPFWAWQSWPKIVTANFRNRTSMDPIKSHVMEWRVLPFWPFGGGLFVCLQSKEFQIAPHFYPIQTLFWGASLVSLFLSGGAIKLAHCKPKKNKTWEAFHLTNAKHNRVLCIYPYSPIRS